MLANTEVVALWWHTVGAEQTDLQNVPKIYCSFISMLLQNAAHPSLILHHYKSCSISLPLCSRHPLLAVNILPLYSLISSVSRFFSFLPPPLLPFLSHFHLPPHIFSHVHLSLPLHLALSSLDPLHFSSSCPRRMITKPCVYPSGIWREGRRERKSGLAYETAGDDERIRCYVWMT